MAISLALAGLIGSGIAAGSNLYSQWKNKQSNLTLQKQAWAREDTAVQRRVADLKAAGLSPTLAAGSSASTMSPIQTQAIQGKNFMDVGAVLDALKLNSEVSRSKSEALIAKNMANQAASNSIMSQLNEYDLKKRIDAKYNSMENIELMKKVETAKLKNDLTYYNNQAKFNEMGAQAPYMRMALELLGKIVH